MTEPLRWMVSRAQGDGKLLEAGLAEAPSSDALARTVSRLSRVGVAIGAAGVTLAQVSQASTLASGPIAKSSLVGGIASTAGRAVPLVGPATVVKGVAVGFVVGSTLLAGGHYASVAGSASPQATANSTASLNATRATTAKQRSDGIRSYQAQGSPESVASSTRPAESVRLSGRRARREGEAAAPNNVRSTGERPPAVLDSHEPEGTGTARLPTEPSVALLPRAEPLGSQGLAREVAAVARARQALAQGDAVTALGALAAIDSQGGYHALGQEASLLRVEALAQSGQRHAAAVLARQLLVTGVAEAHRAKLVPYAKRETP